jgi:hypothetical protein
MEAHWVGYDKDSMHAHRVYWPNKHRVSVEHNVKFAPLVSTVQVPSVSLLINQTIPLTAIPTPTQQVLQPTRAVSAPPRLISTPISGQTLVGSTPIKQDANAGSGEEEPTHEEVTAPSQPPTPQLTATAP